MVCSFPPALHAADLTLMAWSKSGGAALERLFAVVI
jgi:hypothetical protein